MPEYDFGGYATKSNIQCSDGRVIMDNAFKHNDGKKVPLVWFHKRNEATNVLGHAVLENRGDSVYARCKFNATPQGANAKELVRHGDITSLSIYANKLKQRNNAVLHGDIIEVSLVPAGANPGAVIDNVTISHGDDFEISENEVIIYMGETLEHFDSAVEAESTPEPIVEQPATAELEHKEAAMPAEDGKTIGDVFDSLTEEQKKVVYFLVGSITGEGGGDMAQDGYGDDMNVFEGAESSDGYYAPVLSHDELSAIFKDAQRQGSLKEAVLEHAASYGITDINMLFPDAKTLQPDPEFIKRRMGWVGDVLGGSKHTPFSRIKTVLADITADEARARGYVKASLKKEEVIKLLKRTTEPTTVYKKQKLDRDDMIDITDFDVISWLKMEMRMMLDEELARAVLLGDGRDPASDDKINEEKIRPIWKDDEMFAHRIDVANGNAAAVVKPETIIDEIVRSREVYEGTGSPALFCAPGLLTDMLLLKDTTGRRLYNTEAELASALRVSKIVEVPLMKQVNRTAGANKFQLLGILINMSDYTLGADKGGEVSFFDDFDIDYNQQKYLLEARCSGALTHPKSAIIVERKVP